MLANRGCWYNEMEDNTSLHAKVIEKLSEHDVIIEKNDIYRLHRSGKPYPMNKFKEFSGKKDVDKRDKSMTSPVIINFTNWDARSLVYNIHYNKNASIYVKCDLTNYRNNLLKSTRNYLKQHSLKGYCYNDSECRLLVKDAASNQHHVFSNFEQFMSHAEKLVVDENFHKKRDNQ